MTGVSAGPDRAPGENPFAPSSSAPRFALRSGQSEADRARHLRALFATHRYARVLAAARDRIELAGASARTASASGLTSAERSALADLLGLRSVPGENVRVSLSALDSALRVSTACASLREVLEAVGGPLRDRRAERDAARADRDRFWDAAAARLAAAGRDDLTPWLEGLRTTGAVLRAAHADPGLDPGGAAEPELLARAVDLALRLPEGGTLLPVLAAECTGDPHALDPGAPLAGLGLRAAAVIAGWSEVPTTAAGRRQLWAEVGVDCDALSAQALLIGLRPRGASLLARQLRESAEAGEPRRVTLRELRRAPSLALDASASVFVCENPAVVAAAADRLGPRSGALVCTEGVPSTAVMDLLRRLAAGGARLLAHADLDWAGLRIAGQVIGIAGASPWRYGAADYLAALDAGAAGPALFGREAPSPWDPALAAAMRGSGPSVPEERMLEDLVSDLAC